ncbi:hypothetical protein LNP17_26165 [Klebsiella variicola subsp. variicola]|nr:hypothetical protein [Klebsiella variicola subsp. variicola]
MALVDNQRKAAQVATRAVWSVNQYRRINFWMAILGQFLSPFPAFFDGGRIYGKTRLANFPDNRANAHIFILLFYPASRYKTPRAAH